ncbi:MAG TPA: hypothetical protein VIM61_09750 [Chthoniobacterales bacterium]
MKLWIRNILIGAGILTLAFAVFIFCCIALFLLPTNDRDNANPTKKTEMVDLSIRWGQLAPFPSSSQNFSIHTEGNSFTRTFRGSFTDSPQIISQWLKDSRGVSEGTSEIQPDKSTKYILRTAEGASYGEVIVSPDQSHVSFRVSWS